MSTNGMESWAVDLKDVGAIYPFQGSEVVMVIVGLVFWIGWHVIQTRQESAEIEADMAADRSGDETRKAIDRYYGAGIEPVVWRLKLRRTTCFQDEKNFHIS